MERHVFRKMRTPGLVLVFTLLLALGSACSIGSTSNDDDPDTPYIAGTKARDDGQDAAIQPGAGIAEEPSMATGAGEAESSAAGQRTDNGDIAYIAGQIPYDRLVIRTAQITLTVDDVSQATNWVRNLAGRKGGFVFSSNSYIQDEREYSQVTIRIPSDQFDTAILELTTDEQVVQVDSEETSSQDVSQEYVDNASRLNALEATERRFLTLLAEAEDVDAILHVESELTNIRTQIETIKGRQNYLDEMTSYATATVTLHLPDTDVPNANPDDNSFIARIFGDSWASASGFIEGLLAITITLGIVVLAMLPIISLAYAGYRFVRRRFGRSGQENRPIVS